ncbi:MAG: hypothetical protein ABSC65_07735 [Acidobacteriaceae bacterium]|jgi:hypothetical protein
MMGSVLLYLGLLFMIKPVHVSNSFALIVHAPLSRAASLFGPDGERCWAGEHWNPEFLYPQPGKDVQGAVFTVQHGPHKSVWVNTVFDTAGGRMQYVSFIPDAVVSTIDVRLTPVDPSSTRVEVTYARTALDASANDDVEAMGTRDRESGPEWEQAIAKCL